MRDERRILVVAGAAFDFFRGGITGWVGVLRCVWRFWLPGGRMEEVVVMRSKVAFLTHIPLLMRRGIRALSTENTRQDTEYFTK